MDVLENVKPLGNGTEPEPEPARSAFGLYHGTGFGRRIGGAALSRGSLLPISGVCLRLPALATEARGNSATGELLIWRAMQTRWAGGFRS